ncbi:MAG: ABC transporter ATP-binding protein [Limnochordia bacterium]|nr:peptide ABC transporter ATP-binding protein [Bacillota bacterium]
MGAKLDNQTILTVQGLKKYFPIKKGVFKRVVGHVKAVDNVSFSIRRGETVGLVGESGCGKSTTGRCLIRLLEPTAGDICFNVDGVKHNLTALDKRQLRALRPKMQMIFQDPFSSLDPRMSVKDIISEPLKINKIGNDKTQTKKVEELMELVGLSSYQMNRFPHEFSGGQRQRIGIARALALGPELVICDEPVSALDVSVQAQVINLLMDLQVELNLTYLFISHDLSVVEHICDRVMVMYLGKVVEFAASEELYGNPKHPYTEALLRSIPMGDPRSKRKRITLKGDVPDPSNPPSGCAFSSRCPYAEALCKEEEPKLVELAKDHFVSCHFADKLSLMGYKPA